MTTKGTGNRTSAPRETGSAGKQAEDVLEALDKERAQKKYLKIGLAFAGAVIVTMAIALATMVFGTDTTSDKNSVSNPEPTPVVSVPGVGPIQKPATAVPTAASTVAPTIAPTVAPTTVRPTQIPTPAITGIGTGGCGAQPSPCLLSGTYVFGKDGPKGDPAKIQDGSYVLAGLLWLIAQNPTMASAYPSSLLDKWPVASIGAVSGISRDMRTDLKPIPTGVIIKRVVVSPLPYNKDMFTTTVVYEDPYTHQESNWKDAHKLQYVGGRWIVS